MIQFFKNSRKLEVFIIDRKWISGYLRTGLGKGRDALQNVKRKFWGIMVMLIVFVFGDDFHPNSSNCTI